MSFTHQGSVCPTVDRIIATEPIQVIKMTIQKPDKCAFTIFELVVSIKKQVKWSSNHSMRLFPRILPNACQKLDRFIQTLLRGKLVSSLIHPLFIGWRTFPTYTGSFCGKNGNSIKMSLPRYFVYEASKLSISVRQVLQILTRK